MSLFFFVVVVLKQSHFSSWKWTLPLIFYPRVLLRWTTVSDVCNPGVISWFTYVPTADRHLVASCGSQAQALHYIWGSAEGWAGTVLLWLRHVLPCPFSAFPCPSGQFLRTALLATFSAFPLPPYRNCQAFKTPCPLPCSLSLSLRILRLPAECSDPVLCSQPSWWSCFKTVRQITSLFH